MTRVLWWCVLVVASVLLPFVGGAAVIIVSRLRRLRASAPKVVPMIIVWGVISIVQLVGLFVSLNLSSSTDVVVR